jgi:hypothetical protein
MMNRMQQWLARAAEELGVRIVVGYVVHFPDGTAFPTQALFPDLGGALGTLVLDSSDTLDAPTWDALMDQGFATSAFSAPLPDEEFDIGSFADMFAEWGWTSDDKPKPTWMD